MQHSDSYLCWTDESFSSRKYCVTPPADVIKLRNKATQNIILKKIKSLTLIYLWWTFWSKLLLHHKMPIISSPSPPSTNYKPLRLLRTEPLRWFLRNKSYGTILFKLSFKKTIKEIGHLARMQKRDGVGQLHGISAFTGTYHAQFILHFVVAGSKAYLNNTWKTST